jgi:DnaJ-class molecular chaperone
MATDEERRQEYREDARQSCQFCRGSGFMTVDSDGAGPAYACPDCDGTGEEDDE